MEKNPDARLIFARVLTYFVLVMSTLFIIISLFITDIVKIQIFGHMFIHPAYWSGLNIVPIVLLGYMFLGISNNLSAGIYIEKKTYLMPIVTTAGAVVNIVANFSLIPAMGITGAALATFFAYFVMVVLLYAMGRKIYPVPYEFLRIFKIAAATGCIMFVFYYVAVPLSPFLFKIILIVTFLMLMYFLKFFNENEINLIKKLFKMKRTAASSDAISSKENGNLGV